jgi:hypothetical protein
MPFQVTKTSTKPAHAHFFNEVKQSKLKSFRDWALAQPGVLSFNGNKHNDNTWITTIVFTDQASYELFLTTVSSHNTHVTRQAYNTANDIIVTVTTQEI